MKFLSLLLVSSLLSTSALACFQIETRKLENHLFIHGMNVNHRLVLLDDKNEEIKSFGKTAVTDRSGKKNLKRTLNFSNGMIQINPDEFKKEIQIEVDLKKSATKSITRSSGTCAGELKFENY